MRIVFVGSVDFSLHCLEIILAEGGEVVGIINPIREHASINSDYADLALFAEKNKISLHRTKEINTAESTKFIITAKPDIIFVFGFSQLIGPDILNIPPLGVIGVHPTLLPQGRGRHPIIWALIKGLKKSGLSFFYMNEGADTGDILWQKPFPILFDDDASTLYSKIKILAYEAISEFLPLLADGRAHRHPQNSENASEWPKRSKIDGEIDWSKSATEIYNLIRALTHPYPGAHTYYNHLKIIVWRARLVAEEGQSAQVPSGMVLTETDEGIMVQTGNGVIELLDWHGEASVHLAKGMALQGLSS